MSAQLPAGTPPARKHRHRLATVAITFIVVLTVLALPLILQSVFVELVGEPEKALYPITTLPTPVAGPNARPAPSESYMAIVIDNIDEATGVATLRVSGQRACRTDCPSVTIVL